MLRLFQQDQLFQEQVEELKQLLEPIHEEASNNGDLNLAREIASILVSLKGMLSGRLRPPDRICKRCGEGKVRAEKDFKEGKWFFPREKFCRNCDKELYG